MIGLEVKLRARTLVATGTGSGKTETYLWPILDHCRRHKDRPGIKAILIYPMNALANDQARRLASALTSIPSLSGVRAGIYADAEPKNATYEVTADSIITHRETMRREPPDILLTNYKMLDFLSCGGATGRCGKQMTRKPCASWWSTRYIPSTERRARTWRFFCAD